MYLLVRRLPRFLPAAAFIILLLTRHSFPKDNKQREASDLYERARALSDVRFRGAPAFRLRAEFILFAADGSRQQGTYTEMWVGTGQWRRETVIGNFRRVEVGGKIYRWTTDSAHPSPLGETSLSSALTFPAVIANRGEVETIQDRQVEGVAARCVVGKLGVHSELRTSCFDKINGVLLSSMGSGSVDTPSACRYGEYQEYFGKQLPLAIECSEAGKVRIQAKILELLPLSDPDPSLFEPLAEAEERSNCQGVMRPPEVTFTHDPQYPRGAKPPELPPAVQGVLGKDGVLRELKIVRSAGAKFDAEAQIAVERWRFKPATCDGQPVPMPITVEVAFPIVRAR